MANTITVTQVDDSLATIIAAEALGYLKANTVLARLVRRDWDNEVAKYGQVIKIPFRGAVSANDKAAGTAVTLQQIADTSVSVTLNKHKEATILIDDPARMMARPDFLRGYIADSIAVIAEQIDADLAGLYSGFSQTISALTAAGGLTEATFRQARRYLNAAKAPIMDRFAVLNEDADYEYLGIEKALNRDYAASLGQAAADSYVNRFLGFQTFMDQRIVTASSQNKNLFFQRSAMVLAVRPMEVAGPNANVAQVVMDEDGIGLRVTVWYNGDYLGWQATVDVLYGVAELRDTFGVVVSTTDQ